MRQCDVVVVGAGLAGLSAAESLSARGMDVALLEGDDDVGGRVRTDVVDGFLLDRGFQVLSPAYPEVVRQVDLAALRPFPFLRGVHLNTGGRDHLLAGPRESPLALPYLLRTSAMSITDVAMLAALSARDLAVTTRSVVAGRARTTRAELARWGLSAGFVDSVMKPFLAGVFLEDRLVTSSRFFHLVWRCFCRAAPVLPAEGMGALPRQLAARLPRGSVRCGARVSEVDGGGVRLDSGERVRARAVVVATDGTTAAQLVPVVREPQWNAVTTFYHRVDRAPRRSRALTLDPTRRILNTVVLSEVAPSYSPDSTALVGTSVLGVPADLSAAERGARERLGSLYGTSTRDWEFLASAAIERAVPAMPAKHPLRRTVRIQRGLYVCGDHRDTSSIQGALFSGHRAAAAVVEDLDDAR